MGTLKRIQTGAMLVALLSMNSPVFAQSASDLLSAIKASKAAGSDSVRVNALHTQTLVTVQSDTLVEESVKDRAITIARLVAQDKCNNKPLTVLFSDKAGKTKEVSFDTAELTQLAAGSEIMHLSIGDADQAFDSPVAVHTATAVATASLTTGKYQSDRSKIADRIEALRSKGVGIAPFVAELNRIDDTYKHGGVAQATSQLAKLDGTLSEQERFRTQMQAIAARQSSQVQPASYTGGSGRVVAAVNNGPSVADYHGSMDGFVEQMINGAVAREVGRFMPNKGPFLVERFRIAKRLHELEVQRVRVDGYANLWRNMEELVSSNDPRKLTELNGDVRYLQSQLGLAQLEGRMTKQMGLEAAIEVISKQH